MDKFFLLVLFLGMVSCHSRKSYSRTIGDSTVKPLVIYNVESSGWGDIGLSIVSVTETDSASTYKAVSVWQGRNLGLLVVIPKKVGKEGFGEGLELESIGTESDYLLSIIARLYQQKLDSAAHFANRITVSYVDLGAFAKSLGGKNFDYKAMAKYKIFFEGKKDGEYAELYLNINMQEKTIEIREKDEEYRALIIRFLKK